MLVRTGAYGYTLPVAIRLAIVGCGGMGHRHLGGLGELRNAGLGPLELVAACDPVEANAASLADQAEARFGTRPAVVSAFGDLHDHGVQAVDITSTPRTHHLLAVEALQAGLHVLIEKPLALTVAACRLIRDAAVESTAILSVAENYRRDPMCRLAKALLDSGVIGVPRLIVQHGVGGGDRMAISMWRHRREHGGILLDVGVHFADVLEYLLGRIDTAYAVSRLHETVRRNPAAGAGGAAIDPSNAYAQWQRATPSEFEATAEDALYATLTFASGVVGSLIQDHAGHGAGLGGRGGRAVFGSTASMTLPGDRSGREITVHFDGGERLEGEALLAQVPDFALEPNTAALFGAERLWRYDHPFTITDSKLLAVEYAELADAIQSGTSPEVDAEQGMRAVACYYAMLESGVSGMPTRVQDAMDGGIAAYQRELNDSLGLPAS